MSKWLLPFPRKSRHLNQSELAKQKYDVTAQMYDINLTDVEVVKWAPVAMTRAERLLLYTLVFTLRPERYLEIGTLYGGSALIVATAMDSLNTMGCLTCVDPRPQIAPENWRRLAHRTTLVEGYSPEILAKAYEGAGGKFDFVLIDGYHAYASVQHDAHGVWPIAADGAYILFHDSFNPDVARAIDDFTLEHSRELIDFGSLTREFTIMLDAEGRAVRWAGLRLLQVRRDIRVH